MLQNHSDEGLGFYAVGENRPTVTAYRAWLSAPSSDARAFFFDFGETTGIHNVGAGPVPARNVTGSVPAHATTVYDARGRRLSAPVKGLNIMVNSNGSTQKVLIK